MLGAPSYANAAKRFGTGIRPVGIGADVVAADHGARYGRAGADDVARRVSLLPEMTLSITGCRLRPQVSEHAVPFGIAAVPAALRPILFFSMTDCAGRADRHALEQIAGNDVAADHVVRWTAAEDQHADIWGRRRCP